MHVFVQLVSTDGSSISDSKSQGANDSVHDMDVTAEKTPMQQTMPTNVSARYVAAAVCGMILKLVFSFCAQIRLFN